MFVYSAPFFCAWNCFCHYKSGIRNSCKDSYSKGFRWRLFWHRLSIKPQCSRLIGWSLTVDQKRQNSVQEWINKSISRGHWLFVTYGVHLEDEKIALRHLVWQVTHVGKWLDFGIWNPQTKFKWQTILLSDSLTIGAFLSYLCFLSPHRKLQCQSNGLQKMKKNSGSTQ